mgnify:CR=1 FL=1|jgi:hypothetical protein
MRSRELVVENGTLNVPDAFLFIPLVSRDSDQLQPPLKFHLVSGMPKTVYLHYPLANVTIERQPLHLPLS